MSNNPRPSWPEFMRPKVACAYLGMERTALFNLAGSDPSFPRKIVFSARNVGWRRSSLDEWLAAKEAGKC